MFYHLYLFYRLSLQITFMWTNNNQKPCTLSSVSIFIEIKDRGHMSIQMIKICLDIIVCPLDVVLWSCGTYRVIFLSENYIICPLAF
jgi:hypothetical protein